jgi:HK97 family phage prohead protease/HK97 family phage major capsid protein
MNELIHLRASFVEKSVSEDDESLVIKGYASTVNKDRVGDVIERNAWSNGGLANYLKNPVILAYHDHKRPIGKMIDYTVDEVGLKITAKISKAAGDITDLIKDGVLQAFSVGVRVKEADYDNATDTFLIKSVELHEVSVVAVPANQDSLFSIAKCFDTETDFAEFKQKFVKPETSGTPTEEKSENTHKEEFIMDSNELEQLISKALSSELSKQKSEEEARKSAEAAELARKAEIVTIAKSGAEALVEDLKKSMKSSEEAFAAKLAELQGDIVAKSEEISRIARDRSKVEFSDRDVREVNLSKKDICEAVLLSKITRKELADTRLGKQLLEKAAANASSSFKAPSDLWEQTLSNTLEEEIQLQLVVAPMFREIQLQAAKQVISVNPDMGYADWVSSANYGATTSTDPEVTKTLTEVTLTAPKLAAKAFLTDETEEDAIIPILPLINEGLARAHARKIEWALLNNNSASDTGESSKTFADGLIVRTTTLSTNISADGTASAKVLANGTSKFTAAHVLAARRAMGKYGVNPADLMAILSMEAWYDLLEDPAFADISQVGGNVATKLTGTVGRVYGIECVVSPEMPAEANSAAGIVLVNPRNFLVPRLRGVTLQSDYDVERQRRVLVATQRLGFSSIVTAAKSVAVVSYDADGS